MPERNSGLQFADTKVWFTSEKWGFSYFDQVSSDPSFNSLDLFNERRSSLFISFGTCKTDPQESIRQILRESTAYFFKKYILASKTLDQVTMKLGALSITEANVIDMFSVDAAYQGRQVMRDINAEGFDKAMHLMNVANLTDTIRVVDSLSVPPGTLTAFAISIEIQKRVGDTEISVQRVVMIHLPAIKRDGVIASNEEGSDTSVEDIIVIKESRDLDNLESRLSNNPSVNTKFNKTVLKWKMPEDHAPYEQTEQLNNPNKTTTYLDK